MKKILLAGLLGGVTIYVWGWFSWVVLPWHNAVLESLSNEDVVMETIQANTHRSGAYMFPGWPVDDSEAAKKVVEDKYKAGPSGFLFVTKTGIDPMDPMAFVWGFLLAFVQALLAASLVSMAGARLPTYSSRVFFLILLGVFAALVSFISGWIWMFLPTNYTMVMTADLIITWLLAGLIIGAMVKPAQGTLSV